MQKVAFGTYLIFLQSDVRDINPANNELLSWIDKSYLCTSAAMQSDCTLMWHKLVSTNKELHKRATGRPTYSHFLCYRKANRNDCTIAPTVNTSSSLSSSSAPSLFQTTMFAVSDIFYRGHMLWPKGIGLDCCYIGVKFLQTVAKATCIFDPFVGQGTVTSMANALGLDAVGIELSRKRCKFAQNLRLDDKLHLVSHLVIDISLEAVAERTAARKAKTYATSAAFVSSSPTPLISSSLIPPAIAADDDEDEKPTPDSAVSVAVLLHSEQYAAREVSSPLPSLPLGSADT
jgi:hypothetical protein